MVKVSISKTAYDIFLEYLRDPRVKKKKIHEKISPYKTRVWTRKLLKEIMGTELIYGPRIWVNRGYEVLFKKNMDEDPLVVYNRYKRNPKVTYIMALEGAYSFFVLKRGASILKSAISVIPSYPGEKEIRGIELTEKGELPRSCYPSDWDEFDWKVYQYMRDPTVSFGKVAGEIGIAWPTVKKHYQKIMNDCTLWMGFFPKGYSAYFQSLLAFKTKYEISLYNELAKIDRSSYIFKYDNRILLHMFHNNNFEYYRFAELRKEGKIEDLKISFPVKYFNVF